jgi:hypothetical protein
MTINIPYTRLPANLKFLGTNPRLVPVLFFFPLPFFFPLKISKSGKTKSDRMGRLSTCLVVLGLLGLTSAHGCPYANPGTLKERSDTTTDDFLNQFMVDDSTGYMTDDVGGQIEDQDSLKAGTRGPTLLEDYIFRQKYVLLDLDSCNDEGSNKSEGSCTLTMSV